MKHWKNTLLGPAATMADAIKVLEASSLQICLVADGDGRLLGTITDGDIRRAILRGIGLADLVERIMVAEPSVGHPDDDPAHLLRLMTERDIRQIPLVDGQRRIVGLSLREDLTEPRPLENWVVLMAGGLGTRLKPMTDHTPKPMLKVGKKPLLESIIENFAEQNFRRFYISVNYKADVIQRHFGDGSALSVEIRYLEEKDKLGTAGALGLLPERPAGPLLVMNGDVLTKVNFRGLLEYHQEQGAAATMCVREYDFQVPFGVVHLDDHRIVRIEEKPVQAFFVNAGIYVLDPDLLDLVEVGTYLDMPALFERAIAAGRMTTAFPVREYWLDVGRMDDFLRAESEFNQVFR